MGPAAVVRNLGNLVVACVAVCHQSPFKAFQKALRPFSAAVRLIFEDPNLMPEQRRTDIQPHMGFQGCGIPLSFQHLDNGLIRMDYGMGQKLLLQMFV